MKAYHIRTEGFDPYNPRGTLIIDLLYVPEREILVGFSLLKYGREGVIKNRDSELSRAQATVDGNQDGIEGEVVGEIDLNNRTISRIINSFSFCKESTFEMTGDYNGSTECLVAVLSGELRQRRLMEGILARVGLL